MSGKNKQKGANAAGKPGAGASRSARRRRARRNMEDPRPGPSQQTSRPRLPAVQSGSRQAFGTDILVAAPITDNTEVGKIVVDLPINPRFMTDTRLCAESKLWARWRPKSLMVRMVSGSGYMAGGSAVLAWVANPSEVMPKRFAAVQKAAAFQPNATAPFATPEVRMAVPCVSSRKWYMCEGPLDDSAHGKLVVVVSSRVANLKGTFSLSIYLDWHVEFEGPDLPTAQETYALNHVYIGGWKRKDKNMSLLCYGGSGGGYYKLDAVGYDDPLNAVYGALKYYKVSTEAEPSGEAKHFCSLHFEDQIAVPGGTGTNYVAVFANAADQQSYATRSKKLEETALEWAKDGPAEANFQLTDAGGPAASSFQLSPDTDFVLVPGSR